MHIYIIMGVAGVGKTLLGKLLAEELDVAFYEADDFHSAYNIGKMKNGNPLNDEDRRSWLQAISEKINSISNEAGAVFTCSALKEEYRNYLVNSSNTHLEWIYLYESYEVIFQRMESRADHFFKPELLKSQFDILEPPAYGIHIQTNISPDECIRKIVKEIEKPKIGIIGLGVMGKSLALNMADNDVAVSVYNRELRGAEEGVARSFSEENREIYHFSWFDDLKKFVNYLPRPRNILLMIKAGATIDSVISELHPLLDEEDLIIDAGNSHYMETARRSLNLQEQGILYLGTGISGGEEGARKGPSIMPGGSRRAYDRVGLILQKIAAKDKNGKACCSYIGEEGSGHFVKMLHNGIEYGEMQLIAEFYHFMRFYLGIPTAEIASIFTRWNKELKSYLIEISIEILQKKEDNDELLLDKILDAAGQKGTGGWSTQAALKYGVALDTITAAVMARNISGEKDRRSRASKLYAEREEEINPQYLKKELFNSFKAVQLINHGIGFDLLVKASREHSWNLNLSEIARIWTKGCIIRSSLMESLVEDFKEFPEEHLLLHPNIVSKLQDYRKSLLKLTSTAMAYGCPMPVTTAASNYFLNFISFQTSANMVQAQRDYFGAHTYERTDEPRGKFYHTQWKKDN